jgi:hypothetical protein
MLPQNVGKPSNVTSYARRMDIANNCTYIFPYCLWFMGTNHTQTDNHKLRYQLYLLQKLVSILRTGIVIRLMKKLPANMGYEDSLSCSEHPTTGQYLNHFNPVHTQALSGAIVILASPSKLLSFLHVSQFKLCIHFSLPPFHSPNLNDPN